MKKESTRESLMRVLCCRRAAAPRKASSSDIQKRDSRPRLSTCPGIVRRTNSSIREEPTGGARVLRDLQSGFPSFLRCCTTRTRGATDEFEGRERKLSSHEIEGLMGEQHIGSPTIDSLSEKKRDLVTEMRARLDALPPSQAPRRHDLWLKRFLAHGKWNVDKSLDMYLAMEKWRLESGADTILDEVDNEHNPTLPIDLIGFFPYSFDRMGRIIVWMRVGHVPWWRTLFEKIDEEVESQLWMAEFSAAEAARKSQALGTWRERAVVLVDLSDLDMPYFQGLAGNGRARKRGSLQSVAQYYPGLIEKAYVLNAPGFASKAWSILKMFLSKQLMEKAEMVSTDEAKASMLMDLGEENVPRDLGGQSDGAKLALPEHLQMPSDGWSQRIAAWRPQEIKIKGLSHEELVSVPPGGRVRWQWSLISGASGFEVFSCSDGGGQEQSVVAHEDYTFNDVEDPVCGELPECVNGGSFKFVWSSSKANRILLVRLEVVKATDVVENLT